MGFYLNHSLIKSYTVSLPPYKNITTTLNYTYNKSGIFNFEIIANPSLVRTISNTSTIKSNINIKVKKLQSVLDIPSSIPDNNIQALETFSLYKQGISAIPFIDINFNKNDFLNNIVFSQIILSKIFYDLSNHMNILNGLYIRYNNNTSAYSTWIQGNLKPEFITTVVSTFSNIYNTNYTINLNYNKNEINNQKKINVNFIKIDNNKSICYFYQQGWTKIIAYKNNSNNYNSCLNIIKKNYQTNNYNSIESIFTSNPVFIKNSSKFIFTNVSNIGLISTYNNNNSSGFYRLFDSKYGTFINYIIHNNKQLITFNKTCKGILSNQNNTHVCSDFISLNTLNFSIVNSTEFTKNYKLGLYSIVNNNLSIYASRLAQSLINRLNFNQTSFSWKTINKCSLDSTLLNCSYYNFNYLNSVASLNITNKMNNSIKINTIACYDSGFESNQTINKTIGSDNSLILNISCNGLSSQISIINSYNLIMNYTVLNKTKIIKGLFNLSNRI